MIRTLIFFVFTLFIQKSVLSQNIIDTRINVKEKYIPKIPNVKKLDKQAVFEDSVKSLKEIRYDYLDFKVISKPKIRVLNPAKVKSNILIKKSKSNFGINIGNKYFSFVESNYSKEFNKNSFAGVTLANRNYKYTVINNTDLTSNIFSSNAFLISRLVKNKLTLNFSNNINNYKTSNPINNTSKVTNDFYIKSQNFNVILESPLRKDKTKYNTIFNYQSLKLNQALNERKMHLSSELVTKIKNYKSFFNVSLSSFHYDETLKSNELFLNFTPSLDIKLYSSFVKLGISLDYFKKDKDFDFFPVFTIKKILVPNIISLEFGSKIHVSRNYIVHNKNNPFLVVNPSNIRNTKSKLIYVNFFNVLSSNEILNLQFETGYFKNFKNFENYIHIDSSISKVESVFFINYTNLWQSDFKIEYSNKIRHFLKIVADINLQSRSKKNLSNISRTYANLSSNINLQNKIKIIPQLSYKGKTKSFLLGQEYEMNGIINFNLHLNYIFNEKVNFNIKLNNITNNKNEIFRSIMPIGFNLLAGFYYRF